MIHIRATLRQRSTSHFPLSSRSTCKIYFVETFPHSIGWGWKWGSTKVTEQADPKRSDCHTITITVVFLSQQQQQKTRCAEGRKGGGRVQSPTPAISHQVCVSVSLCLCLSLSVCDTHTDTERERDKEREREHQRATVYQKLTLLCVLYAVLERQVTHKISSSSRLHGSSLIYVHRRYRLQFCRS